MKKMGIVGLLLTVLVGIAMTSAQDDFAATMDVLAPGVEVIRVNTSDSINVRVEAIVGVGDTIITGESGQARINFFNDGTAVTLRPNSEYRIDEFRRGADDSFILRTSVIRGEVLQSLNRVLNENSAYIVETPGMTLNARGTVFAVRVENSERSGTVVREGTVEAETDGDEDMAAVRAGFGIRSTPGNKLSDVVEVNNFAQLDSYIDGCAVQLSTEEDVSLNVRLGPSVAAPRVSFIDASNITLALGTVGQTGWYRVQVADSFGWVLSSTAEIQGQCAGLRQFAADHLEDPNSYNADAADLPLLID